MASPSPMNNGDSIHSYAKNSKIQEISSKAVMDTIKEIIHQNLDVKHILASSRTFRIADLGCSTGPNTFFAMQNMSEAVVSKYTLQGLDPENLEFQVFFSDQPSNDFNTLFASLPLNRGYFAAGVPGSFHGRVFPSSSIHFAYSSFALHWLSKAPEELTNPTSRAWNPGKIHYMTSPDGVANAYAAQFEKDMESFLSARAEEIVPGGMVVILMLGTREGSINSAGLFLAFLGSILMEMVEEGLLSQDQVDAFNFPHIYPSVEEMTRLVAKNGCFITEKIELKNLWRNITASLDTGTRIIQLRSALEGTFATCFGSHIVDQMFKRAVDQKHRFSDMLNSSEPPSHLFAVLKRTAS